MSKEINILYNNTTNPTHEHTHQISLTDPKNNVDYKFTVTGCNNSNLSEISTDILLELGRTSNETNSD